MKQRGEFSNRFGAAEEAGPKGYEFMKGSLRVVIIVALVAAVALAGGGGFWAWRARHPAKSLFRTGTVRKGNLVATITATGTVEPEEVVDVGAQVSGQFLEFGKDKNGKPIDYGSMVESNMLLAKIDTNLFQADVDLDTAVVASDKAGEAQAAANLEQMKAKEAEAEADWKRAQMLGPSEALAPTTYDSYKANYEIAKAKRGSGRCGRGLGQSRHDAGGSHPGQSQADPRLLHHLFPGGWRDH